MMLDIKNICFTINIINKANLEMLNLEVNCLDVLYFQVKLAKLIFHVLQPVVDIVSTTVVSPGRDLAIFQLLHTV